MVQPLSKRDCRPCEGGVEPMGVEEITMNLALIEGWSLIGQSKIARTFLFKDFKEALGFVNRVGEIAETEGHHPDIHLSWGKVQIEQWTHAINGLSENDFILAAKIEDAFRADGR